MDLRRTRFALHVRHDVAGDGEQGLLFDGAQGQAYTLNATGAYVVGRLAAGDGAAAIARGLAEGFQVDEDTAVTDLAAFLAGLGELGLLEEPPR
ncbi:MAG: PqqD family peptide modification chaperone [Planctomycetes bacterium]|nr:PqqD family peptide modification chaperone [Planctomycetota bacterium]